MINSEVNCNVLGNSGNGMPSDHKYSPLAKKIALRDVQNNITSLIRKHPECSPVLKGKPTADAIKVSATKRLAPSCHSSPNLEPSLTKNARRKFKSEPINDADCLQTSSKDSCHKQQESPRQRTQMRESNLFSAPAVRPNHMSSMVAFPCVEPSVPVSIGKDGNGLPADFKATDEQLRTERFLHLQKFLKQCEDESNQRDCIHMLVNMPPAELSRYAVELEKRAIHLTMEEGKQIQRMKALNILAKSGSTSNPLMTSQVPQSKK